MMAQLTRTVEPLKITDPILDINGLHLYYGTKEALHNISLAIPRKRVTAFIGPSGCGKSTLLRCFNRMNDLIDRLKQEYTVIIVTHNMQQAARVSDYTAFLYLGELIEFDETNKMFTAPSKKQTQDYITGRFG